MRSKARFLGHPIHQMLVVFPLGLLATAVVFDVVALATGKPVMGAVAYWMMAAGLVGAVVASPFGTIDWLAIPAGTRAKRIGAMHGGGNLVVAALFLVSWLLREPEGVAPLGVMAWSFAGAGLALVTAWLGGELVDRLGVGVDDHANLDAPSSLQHDDVAAPRDAATVR